MAANGRTPLRKAAWLLALALCPTPHALAGDRRDIVFDCPCSAEWVAGQRGEPGVLTVAGGIRSFRATESGEVFLTLLQSNGSDTFSVPVPAGRLDGRGNVTDRWSFEFAGLIDPSVKEIVEIHLHEQTASGPSGSAIRHFHERLALWPVPNESSSSRRRYVDILTDADGDGVGDVNERIAGTAWDDPEQLPGESVIDVLVLYTNEFAEAQGGHPFTQMLHALTVASAIFEDSSTNLRLRIVGMSEVELGERGWAAEEQRKELMDLHGADLTGQFVHERERPCPGAACAYVGANRGDARVDLGGGGSAGVMAHEFGHAMGLAHSALQAETYGAFRWSRGHYLTSPGEEQRRGTIMTYGDRSHKYKQVFSNPEADCGAQTPCGVSMDEFDGADSVRNLDVLRFQVAAHRSPAQDTDGDGFVDAADAAPEDPGDWFDIDGDGIADNADADDDNDGVPDLDDAFPVDPEEWADADGDGIGDNADEEVADLSQFRDPALRAAVERALGKASGAPITAADMASLTSLEASWAGIRDLTGLEHATSLERLDVVYNQIVDLRPLSNLTSLNSLNLASNNVLDVAPLAELADLRTVNLSGNPVRDIRPLSELNNCVGLELNNTHVEFAQVLALPYFGRLQRLGVAGLGIEDLSALAALPLEYLNAADNPLADLAPLAGLTSLGFLDLSDANVTNIGLLSELQHLTVLRLRRNGVSDLSALSGMKDLYNLDLSENAITDLGALEELTNLRFLNLANNRIPDLWPLSALTHLLHLDIQDNPIADLTPLAALTSLEKLHASETAATDIEALSALVNLTSLDLRRNRVSDLSPLAELTSLVSLNVSDAAVSDIEPLSRLTSLEWLVLSSNEVSDLSALSGMARLHTLGLTGNAITDLGALQGLTSLSWLHLNVNRISDVSGLSALAGLRLLNLRDNYVADIGPLVDRSIFVQGAWLALGGNPLEETSAEMHIETLRSWGVDVSFIRRTRVGATPIAFADPTLRQAVARNMAWGHIDDPVDRWPIALMHELRINGRGVASLLGLEAALGLTFLHAASNGIANLSPLAELPDLRGLDLRDNQISDLAPLVANEDLGTGDWVSLDGNPLSEESLNTHIPALLERGVDVGVARIRLTLLAAGERLRFDVSGYFEAVLGGDVTFAVSVDHPGVANAEIDDGALFVTPGDRAGQMAATVTGENFRGETLTLTFAVTVRGPSMVPMMPNGMDAVRQGFVRVVNHGPEEEAGVRIAAVDDAGDRRDGLTLTVGAGQAVHLNSSDLEGGNAGKGLSGGSGRGSGDWRLEVESAADLTALSYIRNLDGFLTPMRNVPPTETGVWDVPIFNPASNLNQASSLRIANLGDERAAVVITGVDDRGQSPGSAVRVEIPGRATRTLTAPELEDGPGIGRGGLGDGNGKWRLRIESEGALAVANLLSSPEGHVTDLSTVPDASLGKDGVHTVPLFPSAADEHGRQGFVRVVNRTGNDGEVDIAAYDDSGRRHEPLKLVLKAGHTAHFNTNDLELGNEAKGLSGSTGPGSGHWRLEMRSDLEIEVLTYIRTPGGFLTAIHDVVPRSGRRYEVSTFNPASNTRQVSRLRIVNPGSRPAHVSIAGIDDAGNPGDEVVQLSVAAGMARTLSSVELEYGGWEQRGQLGDGRGKWRLQVDCEQSIFLMNLLDSPTGHMTNLSVGSSES